MVPITVALHRLKARFGKQRKPLRGRSDANGVILLPLPLPLAPAESTIAWSHTRCAATYVDIVADSELPVLANTIKFSEVWVNGVWSQSP